MGASATAVRRCLASDDAGTAVEYSLIAAAIALAIVPVVVQIGPKLQAIFAAVVAGF